jgi:hypothetical protein
MRKFAFVLYRLEMAIYFERLVRACAGIWTAELLRACPTYSPAPLSTHLLFESSSLPLLKVSGGDAMWGRDLHCELVLARAGWSGMCRFVERELRAQSFELNPWGCRRVVAPAVQ